jgi:hypothetical protein
MSFATPSAPSVRRIVTACLDQDVAAALGAAEGLIGLGEGLTPSGDDFVGGMLFGLAILRRGNRDVSPRAAVGLQRLLERAHIATDPISHALLRDFASGQGPEAMHRYATALACGEPARLAQRRALDILTIGHATGWDLLTGLWAALTMASAEPNARRRTQGLQIYGPQTANQPGE